MSEPSPSLGHLHVAIIMDGNGRWARARGLPRIAGHRAGAQAVSRTVEAAAKRGIGTLTLFAFSSDNWYRPQDEVDALMELFHEYLLGPEVRRAIENEIRVAVIGRRDRLSPRLLEAIERAENATRAGRRMLVRLAVDYSARDAILAAAARVNGRGRIGREEFSNLMAEATHAESLPEVDLLIRTGGEQRLSDFLLWECAYAELYFTKTLWPDFRAEDLEAALVDFSRRERRFGRVQEAAASLA
jgi:undecaprenyl diphosphate synthase